MEMVRLGVLEGPNAYSEDAVLEVDLRLEAGDDLRRHRMSAFYELVTATVREFRDPASRQEGMRPMAGSWQRTPEELLAYTISSLHRAAGLHVEARAVSDEGRHWRVIVHPAGSRATRRAVELAAAAFRDFAAGRTVDLRKSVAEIRRLARVR